MSKQSGVSVPSCEMGMPCLSSRLFSEGRAREAAPLGGEVFRPPGEGGNARAAGGGFSAAPTPGRARPACLLGHGAPAHRSARAAGQLLRAHGGGQAFGADLGSGVGADGERRGVGGGRSGGGSTARQRGLQPRPLPRCPAGPPLLPAPRGPACLRARWR